MSEAFLNSAFLALSGGFQDAYTYNARNEVFCNAQTGNVVLMSLPFGKTALFVMKMKKPNYLAFMAAL